MKIRTIGHWFLCRGLIFWLVVGGWMVCEANTYTWVGITGESWSDLTAWNPNKDLTTVTGYNTEIIFNSTASGHAGLLQDDLSLLSLGSILYQTGALSTTIELNAGYTLILGGTGMTNNSGELQSFKIDSYTNLTFLNSATAGAVAFNLTGTNSYIEFEGNTTAGTAVFTVSGVNAGIFFSNSSTADNATIILSGSGSSLLFTGATNGGSSSVSLNNATSSMDISGLSSGSLTLGTLLGSGLVYLGSKNLIVGSNNQGMTFSGSISDAGGGSSGTGGSLTKIGTGTLTLTGSNSYSGGTTVSGNGVLLINNDNQLGALSGSITLNGGMLMNNSSSVTLNAGRNIYLGAGGGYIDPAYNDLFNLNGQISGMGGLGVAWDCGTVVLNGTNGYVGTTTIGTTAIQYWNDNTANPKLQLGNSNALPGTDLIFGNNAKGNTATLDMNGFNATVAALTGGTNAIVDVLTSSGTSILSVGNNGEDSTFQGVIKNTNGLLRLNKIGTGTLTLSGSNTYSGGTTINAGTLHLLNQNAAQNSIVTLNNGSLTFDSLVAGHAFTLGGLAAASSGASLLLEDSASHSVALSVGNNNVNTSYAGELSGSGTLNKIGTGKLTLIGISNCWVGITMSGGTLSLGSSSVLDNAPIILFNGGTLQYSASNPDDLSYRFSTAGGQPYKVDTNGLDLVTWGASLTSVGGYLNKIGAGTLSLSGSNTYNGGTTINAGTLSVNNSSGLGSGTVLIVGSNAENPATLQYASTSSNLSVGAVTLDGYAHLSLQTNSAIQSSGAININNLGNTITLGGTTWNSGTNSLLYGTILTLGGGAAISLTGAIINNLTLTLGESITIGRTAYTFGSNYNSLYFQLRAVPIDLLWTGANNNQWNTTGTNWQLSTGGLNPTEPNIAFVTDDNIYFSGT